MFLKRLFMNFCSNLLQIFTFNINKHIESPFAFGNSACRSYPVCFYSNNSGSFSIKSSTRYL